MQVFSMVFIGMQTDRYIGEQIITAQLNQLIRSFNREGGEMKSEGYILVGWGHPKKLWSLPPLDARDQQQNHHSSANR
jgi:hypothetical protein